MNGRLPGFGASLVAGVQADPLAHDRTLVRRCHLQSRRCSAYLNAYIATRNPRSFATSRKTPVAMEEPRTR